MVTYRVIKLPFFNQIESRFSEHFGEIFILDWEICTSVLDRTMVS